MVDRINPFNPNSVVTPTLFAGRQDQVFYILRKLAQAREGMPVSFVLQGDRGIGKTALAKLIMYAAEAREPSLENLKFLTGYYCVEKGQRFESALQAALNLLTDKMPESVISRLSQRLGSFFRNGKFAIGAFGASASMDLKSGEAAPEAAMVLKDQAVSALSNIISGLEEVSDPGKRFEGVLLVFDEIHNLADLGGVAQILRAISTTLDVSRMGKISFMVIGYADGIDRFFEGDPSARRHFDLLNLTVMPHVEAKEILLKGFQRAGVKVDEQALDRNVDVAGGYPHSIQVTGHNLIDVDRDAQIGEDDWVQALHKTALELQSKDFSDMYDFRGKGTLREEVLNILALATQPLSKQNLKEKAGGKNIYNDTCLGVLKRTGAVKELHDSTVALHSMLFRAAILFSLYLRAAVDPNYKALIANWTGGEGSKPG